MPDVPFSIRRSDRARHPRIEVRPDGEQTVRTILSSAERETAAKRQSSFERTTSREPTASCCRVI